MNIQENSLDFLQGKVNRLKMQWSLKTSYNKVDRKQELVGLRAGRDESPKVSLSPRFVGFFSFKTRHKLYRQWPTSIDTAIHAFRLARYELSN